MEHDAHLLEYFDQPPSIKLLYDSANSRGMGVLHTPDFFVIRDDAVGWEEWKTEEDLNRLAVHNQNRYQRDETGDGAVRRAKCTHRSPDFTVEFDRRKKSTGSFNSNATGFVGRSRIAADSVRRGRLVATLCFQPATRGQVMVHWNLNCADGQRKQRA